MKEAFRKARKPELAKLYATNLAEFPAAPQAEIPWSESEAVVGQAARGKGRNDGESGRTTTLPPHELSDYGEAPPTDKELFRGLVPALANSPKGENHLATLLVFFDEEKLAKLSRHCDYLRFINRTCEHLRYDSNRLLSKATLKRWFREHPDNEFGSPP